MVCSRKHIHCNAVRDRITVGGQALYVPGKCCRVTGDIHQSCGRHLRNGFDRVFVHAFPGRVHHDSIRANAPPGQFLGGVTRIGAEEFRVPDSICFRVLSRVLYRLRDDLRTDDPVCLARKT